MKKFLKIAILFLLIFVETKTVFAQEPQTKIKWLIDKNIVEGRPIPDSSEKDYALDENIQRAEFTKLIVYTIGRENEKPEKKLEFKDVSEDYWAKNYIKIATSPYREYALMEGYPDQSFYPEKDISYAEICAILVRAVKSDLNNEMIKKAVWPDSYLNWAKVEGILDGVEFSNADDFADRKDAFIMIYNAMNNKKSESNFENEPAKRGKSFDWVYNTMEIEGRVEKPNEAVKIKPKYSIVLGNGQAEFLTDTTEDTSGMGISQGGSESLILKFNEKTWPYKEYKDVRISDDQGRDLQLKKDQSLYEITVTIPNLEKVIQGKSVKYDLKLQY